MTSPLFTGACTALVTPFLNGKVNYPMVEQLIRRQIDAGIHAIVLCGTTGESATLNDEEKLAMIRRAKAYTGDDCLIIAGTGSNSTQHAAILSRAAEENGADALLVVSPYYNKAKEDGLFLHYSYIASQVHIPLILYNVPSRTGLDIPAEVCSQLSKFPNIAGIKEASSNLSRISQIRLNCPEGFSIWSGSDDLTVPIMSMGGCGAISVISNLFPKETHAMAQAALSGDFTLASSIAMQLMPLSRLLFEEINPIPVKAAMRMIGYDCGECRLPLTAPSNTLRQKLEKLLNA